MAPARQAPLVTVIMPIRNEADFIERSLGSVLAQDHPRDRLEVLVADGMSDDGTREIVQRIAAASDVPVVLVDNPGRIVPVGFNRALDAARGEVIARVDGHCEIASDYISTGVRHLAERPEVGGVGGPIETISDSEVGESIAVAMSSSFGVGGSAFRTVKNRAMLVDTIAFGVYRRSAIDATGRFDEEFVRNQDDEYNYRMRAGGHQLLLTPEMRSRYYSRGTMRRLWRQYYQYGMYKVRVLQKHPRQMQPRQFVPGTLVGSLLLTGAAGLVFAPARVAFGGIAGLYVAANAAASLRTAQRTDWRYLPSLPVAFGALHLGFGLGFLHGLVRFAGRWRDVGERAAIRAGDPPAR